MNPSRAERRIGSLCGRAFALVIPPGEEETERDRLCGALERYGDAIATSGPLPSILEALRRRK